MRQILREIAATNHDEQERVDLRELVADDAAPPVPSLPLPQQVREVKRDRALAHITVMVLDAAKVLEPLLEIITARLLRWAALGASVGLAFLALRAPSWERLAVLAVFMLLAPYLVRKTP